MGVVFTAKASSAVFVGALAASSAAACDFKVGARDIRHPRLHPTANGGAVAGGYLTITNTGDTPDRLIGGTPPAVADTFRRYGIAPIRLRTNIAASKDSAQSSNFDHHSCGDLVTAGEGIVGYCGAPGVVLAHNLLNLEFSKYRQRKARGGSATAER
jgi:hypothetical protein